MKRSLPIDILRAVAVILVLGRHMEPCPPEINRFFFKLSSVWHLGGWIGVDLFFVLSGFLVSGLIFKEHQQWGAISLKSFFIRRGFKIYPAFWCLIFITIALKLIGGRQITGPQVASELLFFQNYGTPLWGPNWSLAVEEHFYFLLALLLFGLAVRPQSSKPFAAIPVIFAGIGLLCLLGRLLTAHFLPYDHSTHLFPSHLRLDSLFFGVLLSYFYHYHREGFLKFSSRHRWLLVALGVLLLSPAFVFQLEKTPFLYTFGLSVLYLGCGMILLAAVGVALPKNAFLGLAGFVGTHSYSIYLWHMPLEKWGVPVGMRLLGRHWNWYWYASLYFLGAIVFGIIAARVIEFPVLRIREKLFPPRSRPLSEKKENSSHDDCLKEVVVTKAV
jgi:peptidoglycan/LPS O-acetylase OafA/YrhL